MTKGRRTVPKKVSSLPKISKPKRTPITKPEMTAGMFFIYANTEFSTMAQVRAYQNLVKKHRNTYYKWEDAWFKKYFDPIPHFMASGDVWSFVLNRRVHEQHTISNVNTVQNSLNGETPIAIFIGNPVTGGHWLSRRPDQRRNFDPYDEYQVHGTNQFCQTYALMNLANALPTPSTNTTKIKYYRYTRVALEFIKTQVSRIPPSHYIFSDARITKTRLMTCIDTCLNNVNLCFNGIELKPRELE